MNTPCDAMVLGAYDPETENLVPEYSAEIRHVLSLVDLYMYWIDR